MDIKNALDYLNKDIILHIDMIESIGRGYAQIIDASGKGVLLFCKPGDVYMISTEDSDTAGRMLRSVDSANQFVAHQGFYIPQILARFSMKETFFCRQAVYLQQEPIPAQNSRIEFKPLNASHIAFVMEHYTHVSDADYIRERLDAGVVLGAYIGDSIAGFMGMHSEGSMGMLEVLPEFRRQGIAYALEAFYANRLLAQGLTPFAQVVTGNMASLELHKKLGFALSEQQLCWVF
jgi:tRNA (guanine37-N1)-methyltransferase